MEQRYELYLQQTTIRSRQLQDQVATLNEQIRCLKDENLRYRRAELDRAREVHELQDRLKKECDRMQRMAVKLAFYRKKEEALKRCHIHNEQKCSNETTQGLERYLQVIPIRNNSLKQISAMPLTEVQEGFNLGMLSAALKDKTSNCADDHPGSAADSPRNSTWNLCEKSYGIKDFSHKSTLCPTGLIPSKEGHNRMSLCHHRTCKARPKVQRAKKNGIAANEEEPCEVKGRDCDTAEMPSPYKNSMAEDLLRLINRLGTENTILRAALVLGKGKEINELEKHLEEIRHSESNFQTDAAGCQASGHVNPPNIPCKVRELQNSILEGNLDIDQDLKSKHCLMQLESHDKYFEDNGSKDMDGDELNECFHS